MTVPTQHSVVRVEGVDVHYAEAGVGRPTVLLHGLSDSYRTWSKVAPRLALTRRILMLDLPGHGLSGRPDASYTLEWHAHIVGGFLEALRLDEVDVVGHSFGGGVAQWLLLEHRRRIRRLALVAAGGLGREVNWSLRLCATPGIVEQLGQPFMRLGTRLALGAMGAGFDREDIAYLSWVNSRPGSARALARSVSDVIDWSGQRRHMLDRIAEVGELPPLSLFWGDRDTIIPVAHATHTAALIDGAMLTRFDGCGHFPHRERPADFAESLTAFVDTPSLSPSRLRGGRIVRGYKAERRSFWRRAWGAIVTAFRAGDARRGRAKGPFHASRHASSKRAVGGSSPVATPPSMTGPSS